MPKLSLAKRHRRQPMLSGNDPEPSHERGLRRSTLRKVSDEDIQDESCDSSVEIASEPCLSPSRCPSTSRRRGNLKRPSPSVCLVDLAMAGADEPLKGCVTPSRTMGLRQLSCSSSDELSQAQDERRHSLCAVSPSSPWGQFVDMYISNDEIPGMAIESAASADSEDCRNSFLPFCPIPDGGAGDAPLRACRSTSPSSLHHEPYPTGATSGSMSRNKRRRILPPSQMLAATASDERSDRCVAPESLEGFFLQVPYQSCVHNVSQSSMVDDAQDAFRDLHV